MAAMLGTLEQAASPEELYHRPASAFVATFVGKAAIVPATIEGTEVQTPLGGFSDPRADLHPSGGIAVVLRPEDVEVEQEGVPARVAEVVFDGDRYLVRAFTERGLIWTTSRPDPSLETPLVVRVLRGWPVPSSGPTGI